MPCQLCKKKCGVPIDCKYCGGELLSELSSFDKAQLS